MSFRDYDAWKLATPPHYDYEGREEAECFCPMCDSSDTWYNEDDSNSMYLYTCDKCGHEWDDE